jgi:hypothetical protein
MINFLKSRFAIFIVFAVALISKYLLLYNNRTVRADKLLQIVGAENILKGKGYTFSYVNVDNFVTIKKAIIHEWPPLYSWLLAAFLQLTNHNFDVSCYMMDIIAVSLFVTFFWFIIKELGFPRIVQLFTLLYVAFYIKRYFLYSSPTDILAVGFLMGAVYFFLSYTNKEEKNKLILLVIFMLATAYTRYMYLPAVSIFPLLLIWSGYKKQLKNYLYGGTIVLLIYTVSIIPLLLQNYWVADSFNNMWVSGFFPKNLFYLSPFIWDMLIDQEFFTYQISSKSNVPYHIVTVFFNVSNYAILVCLLVLLFKNLFPTKGALERGNAMNNFFIAGGVLSLFILALLIYGSLFSNYVADKFGYKNVWTYIMEDRYYIFVHIYLLITLIYVVFISLNRFNGIWPKIRVAVLILFSFETTHGLWVLLKSSFQRNDLYKLEMAAIKTRQNTVDSIVNATHREGYEPVFFLHYSMDYYSYVSFNDEKFCPAFINFDEKKVQLNGPTRIIFISGKPAARTYYRPFLEKNNFLPIHTSDSAAYYSKYIVRDK